MRSPIVYVDQSDWEFMEELNERIQTIERHGVRVLRLSLPSEDYQRFLHISGASSDSYLCFTHKTRSRPPVAIYERAS